MKVEINIIERYRKKHMDDYVGLNVGYVEGIEDVGIFVGTFDGY